MCADCRALLMEDLGATTAIGPDVGNVLLPVAIPDVDEFDLDLRLGELSDVRYGAIAMMPRDAQTDLQGCMPTGGGGAGTTCNTNDNTCPATCAGLNTCPNTCQNTCQDTCPNTCEDTCGDTCVDCATEVGTHCFTCRSGCHIP
jgi:hypothetical protein